MTAVSNLSKLAELRAKTDRDLVLILGNALEIGLQCASANRGAAGPLRHRAEDIYANTRLLLNEVEDFTEKRRLEEKLERLRDSLDHANTRIAFSSAC